MEKKIRWSLVMGSIRVEEICNSFLERLLRSRRRMGSREEALQRIIENKVAMAVVAALLEIRTALLELSKKY